MIDFCMEFETKTPPETYEKSIKKPMYYFSIDFLIQFWVDFGVTFDPPDA